MNLEYLPTLGKEINENFYVAPLQGFFSKFKEKFVKVANWVPIAPLARPSSIKYI